MGVDDEIPTSRDALKRLLSELRSSQADVPELPDEQVSLIWEDHTTVTKVPGTDRRYYLDVESGGLYWFDLTEAWITNLHQEDYDQDRS